MVPLFTALALLFTAVLQGVAGAAHSTALGANSIFGDVITTKMSYYRALASANPLTWDEKLATDALAQAVDCGLLYDYFAAAGQIIFNIGRQDNKPVDIVNATYLAVDSWWDQRHNYTVKSDDYDNLEAFYPTWEFTQMVWAGNTKVGCAWSPVECLLGPKGPENPTGLVDSIQMVCLLTPGGNKWQQWGANVHCPDCAAEPQTSNIDPATTVPGTATAKRAEQSEKAALCVPDAADIERIEAFRTLPLEEFYPGYTRLPMATTQATVMPTPPSASAVTSGHVRRMEKRAFAPRNDD